MSEILLPTWIVPEQETHEWLDEGSSVFRGAFAPGLAQRQSYGGLRLKLSRRHTVRQEEKARLLSILSATRGSYNAMRTRLHFPLRGSMPSSELITNNTFASGTTGWTSDSETTLSVADRIMRMTRNAVTAAQNSLYPSSGATVTQYAPYAIRASLSPGRGAYSQLLTFGSVGTSNDYGSSAATYALNTLSAFARAGTAYIGIEDGVSSGVIAGDYFECPYVSLSRCPIVDNGINGLLQSDAFDNAAWTKTNVTIGLGPTDPTGGSTADGVVETNVTAVHTVSQAWAISSSAQNVFFGVAIRAANRSFAALSLTEATGSTSVDHYFNVSTGAVGSTGSTGANWAEKRTGVLPLGNGWYYCYIIARKTNAATSVTATVFVATADGTSSYLGSSALTALYLWRATSAPSNVAIRPTLTTSAASTGSSQSGGGLYLKGLPASTSGLLLADDWVEINGEIKHVLTSLNSDAAGLGYLQFEPPLVRSPADNDAVIITNPMGKFLVSNVKLENEFGTQARVSYDLEHIYE